MRMVGAVITSAPSCCNARTRSPACSRARVTTIRRPASDRDSLHTGLQSHRPENHYQAMVRDALIRFALRRAARSGAGRPADLWLRLACAWSPGFGPPFAALVELRRAREDRLGAMSAAQAATRRFPTTAAAW